MKKDRRCKPHSKEHRRKISEATKGRERPVGSGRPENTPEVLWSKVDRRGPKECWPWKGWQGTSGYGRVQIKGVSYYAHRVIYDLAYPGKININAPAGRKDYGYVLHRCDNPLCCNPKHLWLGTHADNMADKKAKGRCPDFSGDNGPRCKLTMAQAREIRRLRFKENITVKELAKKYGISEASLGTLLRGDSYREN